MIREFIAAHGGTLKGALHYFFHRITHSDFVRKVSETYLTRIILIPLGLVSSVIVARALGPPGRGYFAVAMTVATLGIQFGNLGLHASNTYYVAKNRKWLPVLIGNSLRLSFWLGGIGGGIAWVVFQVWPQLAPIHGSLLALSLVWIPFGLAYMLFQNLLIGVHDVRAYNKIELGGRFLSIGLIFLIVFFQKVSVLNVFMAGLAGTLTNFTWSYIALGHHLKERPFFSGLVFQETIYYGFKAYINALFAFLVLKVDLLMVQYFLGPEQTGYYSIASNMADMLYLLPSVVGSILFPKLSARKDVKEKWELSKKAMWVVALLMVPLALAAALLAKPFIGILYGKNFLPAVQPFWILCPAMVLYATNNIVAYFFAAVGFPWFSVYVWIIVSVLNVVLNLFLIPAYGITGAAFSSLVCYGSVLLLQCGYVFWKGASLAGRS